MWPVYQCNFSTFHAADAVCDFEESDSKAAKKILSGTGRRHNPHFWGDFRLRFPNLESLPTCIADIIWYEAQNETSWPLVRSVKVEFRRSQLS